MNNFIGGMLANMMQGQGSNAGPLGGLLNQLLGQGEAPVAGLNTLVEHLRQAGLGPQVESWIGAGANQAVAPEALTAALGPEALDGMARSAGMSGSGLAGLLATALPAVVNAMTPHGRMPTSAAELPEGAGLSALLGALSSGQGGAGGLMGGLMGLMKGRLA